MAVNLHASHYRFGLDDGTESAHTFHAAEDTNPAQGIIAVDTPFLLRFTVQETGGTAAGNVDNQFQCRLNTGAFQNITTTSTICKAVAVGAFTNGAACTKRLSGTGTFESSGAGCTEDGLSGGNANDIAASGNSETECGLQIVGADVGADDVIEFRLTSPDFTITNDVVPALTVAGATIVEADGSAVGVGGSSVVGAAVWAGVSAAAGVASDAVVAAALWVGVGSSAGVASDAVVGAALGTAVGSSVGVATDSVVTGATAGADAVSAGVATVDGQGEAGGGSDATAAGVGSATGVAAALALADGSAAGVGTATGVAVAIVAADGVSAGAGACAGVGASTVEGTASATGLGTAASISGVVAGADGSADGLVDAVGTGAAVFPGAGDSAGAGEASAVSGVVSGSVAACAGAGAVAGVGAGTLQGMTKNLVGAPLAGATVKLFRTSDDSIQSSVVSDAWGYYVVEMTVPGPFYIVTFHAGPPLLGGVSVNTLAS